MLLIILEVLFGVAINVVNDDKRRQRPGGGTTTTV